MRLEILIFKKSDILNQSYTLKDNNISKLVDFNRFNSYLDFFSFENESYDFKRPNYLVFDKESTLLRHQGKNYVINEVFNSKESYVSLKVLEEILKCSRFIVSNTSPWAFEDDFKKINTMFFYVKIESYYVYKSPNGQFKLDFTYDNKKYFGFNLTSSKVSIKDQKETCAFLLMSFPYKNYDNYKKEFFMYSLS